MKFPFLPSIFLALLVSTACTETGYTPDCGLGGRASFEEKGCVSPLGGICLTRAEFDEQHPDPVDEEWENYLDRRPHCDVQDEDESN